MTTKEYVTKYELNLSDKFNHSEFVQDLASDFIAILEINKANDNIKGFENALRCIRMKFDSVNNKTIGVIPEKLWNYFFATVVVKLREELCPKDMEKRRQVQEQKKKEWERRKAQEKFENEQFNEYFWGQNFYSFLFSKKSTTIPTESFSILGLTESANEIDVKNAYKKLATIHHPDKGGKQDKFVEITESKNKCLNWLEYNNSLKKA
jgi:hypothetical protein